MTDLIPMPETALVKISEDTQKAELMLGQLQALEIANDEVQATVEELYSFAKKCEKEVNEQRMGWQRPFQAEVTRIQQSVKPLEDRYAKIANICKQKLSNYYARKEAVRAALQKQAEEAIDAGRNEEAMEALMAASVHGQVQTVNASVRKSNEIRVTDWGAVFTFLATRYTKQMKPMSSSLVAALMVELRAIAKDTSIPGTEVIEVLSPVAKR